MGLRKVCALQVDASNVDGTLLNKAVEIPVHLPHLLHYQRQLPVKLIAIESFR